MPPSTPSCTKSLSEITFSFPSNHIDGSEAPQTNTTLALTSSKRPKRKTGPSRPSGASVSPDLLWIRFGGKDGSLDWNTLLASRIEPFIENRFTVSPTTPNSLEIEWPASGASKTGNDTTARKTLQNLFHFLSIHRERWCPLATFTKITIQVPNIVNGPTSCDGSKRIAFDKNDMIDLLHASHVKELYWKGDFFFLNMAFSNVPSDSLSVLSLTECELSIHDALAVLHECPNLTKLVMMTVVEKAESGDIVLPASDAGPKPDLAKLRTLTVRSMTHPMLFVGKMKRDDLKKVKGTLQYPRKCEMGDRMADIFEKLVTSYID